MNTLFWATVGPIVGVLMVGHVGREYTSLQPEQIYRASYIRPDATKVYSAEKGQKVW